MGSGGALGADCVTGGTNCPTQVEPAVALTPTPRKGGVGEAGGAVSGGRTSAGAASRVARITHWAGGVVTCVADTCPRDETRVSICAARAVVVGGAGAVSAFGVTRTALTPVVKVPRIAEADA